MILKLNYQIELLLYRCWLHHLVWPLINLLILLNSIASSQFRVLVNPPLKALSLHLRGYHHQIRLTWNQLIDLGLLPDHQLLHPLILPHRLNFLHLQLPFVDQVYQMTAMLQLQAQCSLTCHLLIP